ncbi:MAG: hypothetical protein ACQETD_08675, partial [Pseudomonadota bacterium]
MDKRSIPAVSSRLTLALLLTLITTPAAMAVETIELGQLPGLKSLFSQLVATHAACDRLREPTLQLAEQTRRTAQWQQFSRVATVVLGNSSGIDKLESHHACRAFHHHASLRLSANPGTVRRDRLAERLYMLGYTPHEIADVLAGLIPMYALQRARRMQALGYSHTDIEHYLSRHSAAPVPAADNTTAGN